jgi:hypothetical protein
MTDACEVARSELADAALPPEGKDYFELAIRAAEPNESARHGKLKPADTWIPVADEHRCDKAAVPDVRRARSEAASLLMLVNGAVGAIAGAYAATRSVQVTALACGAALLLAVLVARRK